MVPSRILALRRSRDRGRGRRSGRGAGRRPGGCLDHSGGLGGRAGQGGGSQGGPDRRPPAHWSDGSLTLPIPLRTGVLFHDGTPMTSADVVPSLKRWLKLASLGQRTGPAVKDIVAKDANTVVIQL